MRNVHRKQYTVEVGVEIPSKEVVPVAVFRALGTTSLETGSSTVTSFLFPSSIESSSFILCVTLRSN